MILTSEDGLFFDYDQGHRFGVIADYIPADQLPAVDADVPCGCFERPQLLFKDGIPTHLFTPCGRKVSDDMDTCCYLFAIDNVFSERIV